MNAKIEGFVTIQEYIVFCDLFVTHSKIGTILLNGNVEVNILLKSLDIAINSELTYQLFDNSIIIEANNFIKVLYEFFNKEIDVTLRFKFVSAQYKLLSKQCQKMCFKLLILDIDIKIHFFHLISPSLKCMNNNDVITFLPISEEFTECCKIDKHKNTELEIAFDNDLPSFLNQTEKMSLVPLRKSIANCIHKLHKNDHIAAHQCCIPIIKENFDKELLTKIILWPVFVQLSSTLEFGNLCGFCGC
uniref:Uncharacterized protein n=1 Tax=Meloidogyne hapla TaxID=6305 RepID=A0A1I8BIF5_MELHA